MNLPEYISKDEVKRVCKELGLRDWSKLKEASVTEKEAAEILQIVNTKGMDIPAEDFKQGLEVELEHGIRYDDANVTNNHPLLTGKIVLAHLKETMDYYQRLDVAELEGDLLKAMGAKDLGKARQYILANALEALIGAIYLDQGYAVSRSFIEKKVILPQFKEIKTKGLRDAKSLFQEKAQEIEGITPVYKIVSEWGPDHNKHFITGVYLGDKLIAEGEGSSKQEAHQAAAELALKKKKWE